MWCGHAILVGHGDEAASSIEWLVAKGVLRSRINTSGVMGFPEALREVG